MVIANDTAGLYSTHGFVTPWSDDYFTQSGSWRPSVGIIGHGIKMRSQTTGTGNYQGTSNASDAADVTKRGFNSLLAGNVLAATQYGFNASAYYWTGSSMELGTAWSRYLGSGASGVRRGNANKAYLFSLRCKKN
jgi:hypothetical protein